MNTAERRIKIPAEILAPVIVILFVIALFAGVIVLYNRTLDRRVADCVQAFGYTELQCRVIVENRLPVER